MYQNCVTCQTLKKLGHYCQQQLLTCITIGEILFTTSLIYGNAASIIVCKVDLP